MLNVNANELITYREKIGLTREELARELKTSYVTVFRWEKGERAMPPYLELALETIERKLSKKKQPTGESK